MNMIFGVAGGKAVLKMNRCESDFHKPFEWVLASQDSSWKSGEALLAKVTVADDQIVSVIDGKLKLSATDQTDPQGRIGLVSDDLTRIASVKPSASEQTRL